MMVQDTAASGRHRPSRARRDDALGVEPNGKNEGWGSMRGLTEGKASGGARRSGKAATFICRASLALNI